MRDFTIIQYKILLDAVIAQGFTFSTFENFLLHRQVKSIVSRHDVDQLPQNSLVIAKIQAEKGIKGTYYFRTVKGSFDKKIIKEIYSLGHEIGYHYEDLSFAEAKLSAQGTGLRAQEEAREKLLVSIGIETFKKNLNQLREIVPVNTICMHGSPISKWDSRLLWKYYDYHEFGIVGEPYFDIDFNSVMYLTDTGRRWDGDVFNVRDKVHRMKGRVGEEEKGGEENRKPFPKFHSTFDIIKAAEEGKLPDKIMMTFHPQRWTDKPVPWMKELVWQNIKNTGKYFIIKFRK